MCPCPGGQHQPAGSGASAVASEFFQKKSINVLENYLCFFFLNNRNPAGGDKHTEKKEKNRRRKKNFFLEMFSKKLARRGRFPPEAGQLATCTCRILQAAHAPMAYPSLQLCVALAADTFWRARVRPPDTFWRAETRRRRVRCRDVIFDAQRMRPDWDRTRRKRRRFCAFSER